MSRDIVPRCPGCLRAIAAWRLDHCVYCGAAFPPGLREGHAEPEALKWIERPALPPDAARQIEMMKIIPLGAEKRPRSFLAAVALLSVPLFAGLFYLLYRLVMRHSQSAASLIAVGGAGFLIYLVWIVLKTAKGGSA